MLRQLIEKEVSAVKHAVHAVREWMHPTKAMKEHEFDRPLDDLGQSIADVERRVPPPEPPEAHKGAWRVGGGRALGLTGTIACAPDTAMSATSRTVEVNGIGLHVEDTGGSGPGVVFSHGLL